MNSSIGADVTEEELVVDFDNIDYLLIALSKIKKLPIERFVEAADVSNKKATEKPDTFHVPCSIKIKHDFRGWLYHQVYFSYFVPNKNIQFPYVEEDQMDYLIDYLYDIFGEKNIKDVLREDGYVLIPKSELTTKIKSIKRPLRLNWELLETLNKKSIFRLVK